MFGRTTKVAVAALQEHHAADLLAWGKERMKLEMELRTERLKVLHLEKALASSQANVDWLKVLLNNAVNDRAAIAAAKGLTLPAPQVEGTPQTPAQVEARAVAAANAPVEDGKNFTDLEDLDDALQAYTGHVSNFEDLGDEAADKLGIRHADDGTVEYAKK